MGLQVHKRVRLAVRLDEVQRQQTKQKAEQTWRQRTADEVNANTCLTKSHAHFLASVSASVLVQVLASVLRVM